MAAGDDPPEGKRSAHGSGGTLGFSCATRSLRRPDKVAVPGNEVPLLVVLDRNQRWSALVRRQYLEQHMHHGRISLVEDSVIDIAGLEK
jgi:hypothetical protein